MNNALVIAGGQWQVPLINFLKKKGYRVFVVDPYDNSLGVLAGDKHIKADVRDVELIFEQINNTVFNIIITDQSDISIETVADLAQRFGIKSNQLKDVRKFSNKFISREYAKREGFPIPPYSIVRTVDDVENFISENTPPIIIKPCDSQSSKGIHKLDNYNYKEVAAAIKDALSYSQLDFCLAEKFVSGYEITLEGYCSAGKHRTLATSKKSHFRTGIASILSYPAVIPEELERKIIAVNNNYIEKSGINFGITHAEYIVNESTGDFYLIEIACRGGGTLISSDIIKWVSGFDVYEALHSDLLGVETSNIKEINILKRNAILHFFEFPEGKVKEIKGFDEIKMMDSVLEISLNFSKGDTLKLALDDRGRQGFVILLTESLDEQNKKMEYINKTLKIEYV